VVRTGSEMSLFACHKGQPANLAWRAGTKPQFLDVSSPYISRGPQPGIWLRPGLLNFWLHSSGDPKRQHVRRRGASIVRPIPEGVPEPM